MAETTTAGRHRVPGRHRSAGHHNPITELAGMVARVGENGVKATAVLAASGGLVAAFALPASAAPAATTSASEAAVAVAPAVAAPAAATVERTADAPAVVAPEAVAPVAIAAVGVVGVSAVEKPPPPPPPPPVVQAPRQETQASRTATRATPAAEAPAYVPSSAGGILGVAQSLQGIPYVYGGATPAGFDCSGFTSYVYRQVGISIPRVAEAQRQAATPVSDPQPGDLVFFIRGGSAGHVGIYAGGGMMYDSPHTGTVTQLRPVYGGNVVYGRF